MDFFISFYLFYVIVLTLILGLKVNNTTVKFVGLIASILLVALLNNKNMLDYSVIVFIILLVVYTSVIKLENTEYLLYQLAIIGITCLLTSNLLAIFLSIEIINFLSITLIPLYNANIYSLESALKYFLISAISGAIFILGTALLYGETASLDLYFISTLSENTSLVGPVLILISLFIKLGVAPFHAWMPDVYEGTNYKTFIFIALFPKLFLLIILFFLTKVFNFPNVAIYSAIMLCGIVGGVQAVFQQKIKRFLSFTMILNNIFLLLPLFVANITYLILTFGLYIINNLLTISLFLEHQLKNVREIISMNKVLIFVLILSLFSALALPPLLGFFTKVIPFFILVDKNIYLLITAIIFAVLSAFYYLRVVSTTSFYKKFIYNSVTPTQNLAVFISTLSYFVIISIFAFSI